MSTPYAILLYSMQDAILSNDVSAAEAHFKAKPNFPPKEQLSIYTRGYRIRLYETLVADFPALAYYLGTGIFRDLALHYIIATPPSHFNLGRYSFGFADFLAAHSDDIFARDLAQLESACGEVYMAQESTALSLDTLTNITPDEFAQLALLPRIASKIEGYDYPVNEYLFAYRAEQKPTKPNPEKQYLCIVRHRNEVARLTLEPEEYHLLRILASGKPLGEALEAISPQALERAESELQRWLARWLKEGMIRA